MANKSSTSITTTSSSSCCSSRSILCLSMLIRRSCCNTRALSTQSMQSAAATSSSSSSFQKQPAGPPTFLVETNNGRTYRLLDSTKAPKVKPGIINQRLSKMRTYVGTQKNIRHSPWRLNLICQMIAGLPVPEALRQLQFCDKSFAPTVQQVVQKTVNRADIRDGLQPTQLEVAQCFATRGTPLKRIKPMARGRYVCFCIFVFCVESVCLLACWHAGVLVLCGARMNKNIKRTKQSLITTHSFSNSSMMPSSFSFSIVLLLLLLLLLLDTGK